MPNSGSGAKLTFRGTDAPPCPWLATGLMTNSQLERGRLEAVEGHMIRCRHARRDGVDRVSRLSVCLSVCLCETVAACHDHVRQHGQRQLAVVVDSYHLQWPHLARGTTCTRVALRRQSQGDQKNNKVTRGHPLKLTQIQSNPVRSNRRRYRESSLPASCIKSRSQLHVQNWVHSAPLEILLPTE